MRNITRLSTRGNDCNLKLIRKPILLCLLLIQLGTNVFGDPNTSYQKINFDKNPVLSSDSLKKVEPKFFVQSSLDQLTENIYFSSLNNYFFLTSFLNAKNDRQGGMKLEEVLGLKEFYSGDSDRAMQLLAAVLNNTTDSIQKAKICLNLIKISYSNNQFNSALQFVKLAKDSLNKFYNNNQKYELLFTEARIALTLGLTSKAENLIITKALPMSNRVKGRHNEYNCYLFLGKIYLKSRQLTQAKWFFIQANTIAINQHYIDGEIETSLLLAKTKIKVGDNGVALQDLARAKRLIDENHSIYFADLKNLTRLATK